MMLHLDQATAEALRRKADQTGRTITKLGNEYLFDALTKPLAVFITPLHAPPTKPFCGDCDHYHTPDEPHNTCEMCGALAAKRPEDTP